MTMTMTQVVILIAISGRMVNAALLDLKCAIANVLGAPANGSLGVAHGAANTK